MARSLSPFVLLVALSPALLPAQSGADLAVVRTANSDVFVDPVTGTTAATFPATGLINCDNIIAFDRLRTRAAVIGGATSSLQIYDSTVAPVQQVASLSFSRPTQFDVASSPDGRWLISMSDSAVQVTKWATGTTTSFPIAYSVPGATNAIAITADSTRALIAGVPVTTIDLSDEVPVLLNTVALQTNPYQIALTHDSSTAVVCGEGRGAEAVAFFDTASGDLITGFPLASFPTTRFGPAVPRNRIAITPDDRRVFVTAGRNSDSVVVFGLDQGPALLHSDAWPVDPTNIEVAPDGRFTVVTCSHENVFPAASMVLFYDGNGDLVSQSAWASPISYEYLRTIAFTHDSKQVVVQRGNQLGGMSVEVFDLSGSSPVSVKVVAGAGGDMLVTPDDRYAILGAFGLHFFNLATLEFDLHTAAAGSPQGKRWLTTTLDGTRAFALGSGVQVFDLTTPVPTLLNTIATGTPPIDVTVWNPLDPARSDSYGDGCAGTTGVPALELSRPPYLGTTPTLALDNSQAPTPTAGALLVGTNRVAVPVLGCTLRVAPIVALPVAVGASGFSTSLALPGDPILTGVKLDFQGIVLDANAIGGASFSPGLELTLGGL